MRVKYKPKPKIPVNTSRERETTPSIESGKEAVTLTGESTTTVSSSATSSVTTTKEVNTTSLNITNQEVPSNLLVSTSSATSSAVKNTALEVTGSTNSTGLICNTGLTSVTSLTSSRSVTGLGSLASAGDNSTTSSERSCDADLPIETNHLAKNNGRTSSTIGCLNYNLTGSTVTVDSGRQNTDHSNLMTSDEINSSPSFGEGLPSALQAESVAICEDDGNLGNENGVTENDKIEQLSSHRYPSFIESLSSSVLSQVASSHRALGLDQPVDDELVSTSAVETTYKRRCYEESDGNDEEMDVFDNCTNSNDINGSSIDRLQPQQVSTILV